MMTSTMTTKGQVTIPKKVREILGVQTNDRIVFTPIAPGKVLLTTDTAPVKTLFGLLSHRKPSQAVTVEAMHETVGKRRRERAER